MQTQCAMPIDAGSESLNLISWRILALPEGGGLQSDAIQFRVVDKVPVERA